MSSLDEGRLQNAIEKYSPDEDKHLDEELSKAYARIQEASHRERERRITPIIKSVIPIFFSLFRKGTIFSY
jgi:hypothetical protein